MKKLFSLLFIMMIAATSFAQTKANTIKDANGNYMAMKSPKSAAVPTGANYINEDKTLSPVFKTSTGKLYILKMSKKSGKEYKKYLNIAEDAK